MTLCVMVHSYVYNVYIRVDCHFMCSFPVGKLKLLRRDSSQTFGVWDLSQQLCHMYHYTVHQD